MSDINPLLPSVVHSAGQITGSLLAHENALF